jgi:predicted HTH transcriptional regulator
LSGFQQIFGKTNLNNFCAFANSSGGHIVLGIGETKK